MTKLSEFMRLGAMATPQAYGTLFDTGGGTCGLGAAFKAANCSIVPSARLRMGELSSLTVLVSKEWFEILSSESFCPECGLVLVVSQLIPHLNDEHRWTRMQQADLVEAIERKQEADNPITGECVPCPTRSLPEERETEQAEKVGVA